ASRRVYPLSHAAVLREHGERVRIIEVDGPIFFGTADRLATEAWRASEGARFMILDLRRVTTIDASGALMLSRLKDRLHAQHVHLLLAHVATTMHLGQALQVAEGFQERHHADWFMDADRALEWAERQLLQEFVTEPADELR